MSLTQKIMKFLAEFMTVTILCHAVIVKTDLPLEAYTLSLTVGYDGREVKVNFPIDKFIGFYGCLCKTGTESCTAYAEHQRVTYIQENYLDQSRVQVVVYYNRYLCQHVQKSDSITCSKLQESQTNCSATKNCWTYRIANGADAKCAFERVGIVWIANQQVNGNYIYGAVEVIPCQTGCIIVNPTTIAATTLIPSPDVKKFTLSGQRLTGETTTSSLASSANITDSEGSSDIQMKNDITGVVVSFVILALITTIICIVVLCRRRKHLFLVESSKNNSATSNNIPKLVQLHHFDPIYANDVSFRATSVTTQRNNISDPEIEYISAAVPPDSTYYDPDFSKDYTNSIHSLETSMIYHNNSHLSDFSTYENNIRDTPESFHDPSHQATKSSLSDICDTQTLTELERDLVYEDFDCSGFENGHAKSQNPDNIDENIYSNIHDNNNDISNDKNITTETISDIIQLPTWATDNGVFSVNHFESALRNGYSRLNEKKPSVKDPYNKLSQSFGDKCHTLSTISDSLPHQSSELTSQPSRENSLSQPTKSAYTEISHKVNQEFLNSRNQPIRSVYTEISPNRGQGLKDICQRGILRKQFYSPTTYHEKTHISGKTHEYFELERNSLYERNELVSSTEVEKEDSTTTSKG